MKFCLFFLYFFLIYELFFFFFFFSSRRRHTRYIGDWSSDVCSSDLWPAGLAAVLKSGGGLTTRVTFALWLRLPLAPLMVIGNDPVVAVLVVVTVSVEDPLPVTDAGLKDPRSEERRVGRERRSGRTQG